MHGRKSPVLRPLIAALAALSVLAALRPAPARAAGNAPQAPARRALGAADYHRAERLMPYNVEPLVLHAGVSAHWLWHDPDDRFWYRTRTERGLEFFLVDPVTESRGPAFDQEKLAAGLAAGMEETDQKGNEVDPYDLPFDTFHFGPDRESVWFDVQGLRWTCGLATYRCSSETNEALRKEVLSPDRRRAVFIRDWNLWLRDVATGEETRLTTDGVEDFGYATDNAGWRKSDRPIVLWSPDSSKIATFQQDQRKTGEMYLVDTRVGHPELEAWRYPLPGDQNVTMIERVIVDLDAPGGPEVVRLRMPPDQHRSTLCDDVFCDGGWTDVQWAPDAGTLAFISTSRDHKHEVLRVADAATGTVRDVFREDVGTQYESGNGKANWKYLPESQEVVWFSERNDWGQLYLYDLATGKLDHQITHGTGDVAQMLRVDPEGREIYFVGNGKRPGIDPYFRHLYRIGFDGKSPELLTPELLFDHDLSLAPDGRFFVDSYSTPETPPVAYLADSRGHRRMTLETADVSGLTAVGWKPPTAITVKARDGRTDLYGLLFRPTDFDPGAKYPIVDHVYPGPQTGSVGSRSFRAAHHDAQALAELGFVVVEIDGMGTPWRSKSFHDAYYGDMGDNTLPDQVAGLKELARRYPWIDLDRAGIYGHSGGGFATADAMFTYPGFFKVGVAEAGNHDNREYEDDWGERYQGLLVERPDGTTSYDGQANQLKAGRLEGKLLLAHGTMDTNVPPYNTLLVVDALIRANKDFDLVLLPNRSHGFGSEPYMVRRRWDYFVRWLAGATPPHEYRLSPPETWWKPGR